MASTIHSREEFRNWLKEKPREWSQVLALRIALRVLPLIAADAANRPLHLAVFRATFACWAALRWPNREISGFASAAAAAAAKAAPNASAYAVANVADAAADAAAAAAAPSITAAAAAAATAGAYAADAAAGWNEINADIELLHRTPGVALIVQPLWNLGEPVTVKANWHQLAALLQNEDPHAYLWREWYERRRLGGSTGFLPLDAAADERVTARIATQLEAFWDRPFSAVNADIVSWITAPDEPPPPPPPPDPAIDFFISYATADEPMAREIAGILDEAGYSYRVQFRHFVAGTNFVREMQRGLEASGRLIALLSPAYEASDHCQAEWSAAYAEDPGARRGKLIPFKIAEVDLNRLARQITYKSLIGLDPAGRRAAVLEALGHWVKARRDAATIAVPDVVAENGRLVVRPGSPAGAPRLSELRANELDRLRDHAARIRDTYPDNAPRRPLRYLQDYVRALEDGADGKADVEWLNDCVFPFRKAFEAIDHREWPEGFADDVEGFLARHVKFTGHFDIGAREATLETVKPDAARATGAAIAASMRPVEAAVEELSAAGFTSPEFDATVHRQLEIAEQLDDSVTDNIDARLANEAIKGRFLFNQIGFYERMLMATGAIATISASPLLPAAVAAIERAIVQLLALL